MIRKDSFRNQEVLSHVMEGLQDLILEAPLAGLSLLGDACVIEAQEGLGTAATDGRRVFVGETEWLLALTPLEVAYVLLHEWVHIFCNHAGRRGTRFPEAWNVVCDMFVANRCQDFLEHTQRFKDTGLPGCIQPDEGLRQRNTTEEDLYDEMIEEAEELPSLGDLAGDLPEFVPDEDAEEAAWVNSFTEDIRRLSAHFKHSEIEQPEWVNERVKELLEDSAPWGSILRGAVLDRFGASAVTYAPMSRRSFFFDEPMALPKTVGLKEKSLLISVDVSGSVHSQLLSAFVSNIVPLCHRAKRIFFATFDSEMRECVEIQSHRNILENIRLTTGAHSMTSTLSLFSKAKELNPTAHVILTDGAVALPEDPVPQTIWVLPRNVDPMPWGRSIHIRTSW